MREILFRGKRIDNGEWVEGWYQPETTITHYNGTKETIEVSIVYKTEYGFWEDVEVIPDTVGQYTGLTDKKGKRIFEGDILRYNGKTGYVVWDIGCFCVKVEVPVRLNQNKPAIDVVIHESSHNIELIGNIHDNPKLLTGGD